MRKSELYRMCIEEFFKEQQTETNKSRINTINDINSINLINLAQQSATESVIEIVLNILSRIGLIENDIDITSEYRTHVIIDIANGLKSEYEKD